MDYKTAIHIIRQILVQDTETALQELEKLQARQYAKPISILALALAEPQELLDILYTGLQRNDNATRYLFWVFLLLLDNPRVLKRMLSLSKGVRK